MTDEQLANRVINDLGGPTAVGQLFTPPITHAAVSQWRRNGIPAPRLQLLRLLRPEVFTVNSGAHVVSIADASARRHPHEGGVS